MKKFMILFAFITKDGFVETDEHGKEIYRREDVCADTEEDALAKFKNCFKNFNKKPEVIDIFKMEVQTNGI